MSITSDATQISNDAAILHQIIHGDEDTSVTTEGGNVNTIARAIKEVTDTELAVSFGLGNDFDRLSVNGVVIEAGPHLTGPQGPEGPEGSYNPGSGIDIAAGTISVASNVARKNANNAFSVGQTFGGGDSGTVTLSTVEIGGGVVRAGGDVHCSGLNITPVAFTTPVPSIDITETWTDGVGTPYYGISLRATGVYVLPVIHLHAVSRG